MRNKNFKITSARKASFKTRAPKGERRLKRWHILLIVLGVVLVSAAITVGVLIGRRKDGVQNPEAGGGPASIDGEITSIGRYTPNDTGEYVVCEYRERFSGKTTVFFKKASEVPFDYKAHYVFITEEGTLYYNWGGEYTGQYTPEQIKADLFSVAKSTFGYTDEKLALCDVAVYEPISFTRVKISEITVAEGGGVTLKYRAGAVGGALLEEYTLTGTATQSGNDFTFSYTNLPEEDFLRRAAEKVLLTARYKYYSQYGAWENTLTFGDAYTLYLRAE